MQNSDDQDEANKDGGMLKLRLRKGKYMTSAKKTLTRHMGASKIMPITQVCVVKLAIILGIFFRSGRKTVGKLVACFYR